MTANMTDQELASLYLRYNKRPAGCLPFVMNEDLRFVIPANEVFCRIDIGDGNLCVNDHRYNSTNALRLHINKEHTMVLYTAGLKGPVKQSLKVEANAAFAKCQKAVIAHLEKIKDHRDDIDNALTPKKGTSLATKKVQREIKQKSAVDVAAAEDDSDDEEKQDCPLRKVGKGSGARYVPNAAKMRRIFGIKAGGKTACGACKAAKNKQCPDVNAAPERWDDAAGCEILQLFEYPFRADSPARESEEESSAHEEDLASEAAPPEVGLEVAGNEAE